MWNGLCWSIAAIASELAGHASDLPPREPPSLAASLSVPAQEERSELSRSELPRGTLTFLFTDIEGSTQLWEQHPQTMPHALARHDSMLRQAIAAHAGVVFKTVGDSMYAVFVQPADALAAALAAQQMLHAADWDDVGRLRVRMALHIGTAEPRDGDYFGGSLNRLARILALGHGGQILLSHTTRNLLVDNLPSRVTLRDLGEYSLENLSRPERLFQLVSPELPVDFPALHTTINSATPAQTSSLLITKLHNIYGKLGVQSRTQALARARELGLI